MNMQTDVSGGGDIIDGFVLPPTHIVGETMNKFAHELTSRVHDDHFYGIQSGNGSTSFSSSPQISTFYGTDRFMEGIPLPYASIGTFQSERYISIENQEKLTIPVPLGCPLENAKYGVAMNSCLDVSFETMLHNSYGGGVPLPPELVGRVVGRSSLPPPAQPQPSHRREWSTSQDSSQLSNELSLSLVTSRPSVCSEMSSNGVTSYSLHGRQILPDHTSCSSSNNNNLLSGSRFVEAMQEILAEIACYALENIGDIGVNASFASSCIEADHNNSSTLMFPKQEMNLEAKKKHLLALLQMVDDQYSQCLDEIHTVTSAFHTVTELEPNLHARFALPTISFMYKSLRERISSHILAVGAHLKQGQTRENKSYEACFIQKQWALQQLSKRDHQMWRPQRGLPETSVSVLRTWMFQNFLHPYPKDSEKHLLALRSGLTRNQVSNWFINARVRLWKPMIEEMCAEMNRRKARKEDEEMEGSHRNQMRFETRRFTRG